MYTKDLPVRKGSIYSGESAGTSSEQLPQSTPFPTQQRAGIAALLEDGAAGVRAGTSLEIADDAQEEALSVAHTRLQPVVHVLAGLLCLSVPIDIYNGTLFCWHPIFVTLGFTGLMTEAAVVAINFRRLEGQPRVAAIERHMYLQIASLICVGVGFWAIWQNKVSTGRMLAAALVRVPAQYSAAAAGGA